MIELTEIINNPTASNANRLHNIAALLSSDEAFTYNTTYITDSHVELKRFTDNTIELKKMLFKYSELLNNKLSEVIEEDDLIWAFKLQANNAAEILSDDISFIVVSEKYETQLLKLLASTTISSFVLSLHFKYSKSELINQRYNDSFIYHIQHSFKVNSSRDIRKSILQFVKIVKLHLYAEK